MHQFSITVALSLRFTLGWSTITWSVPRFVPHTCFQSTILHLMATIIASIITCNPLVDEYCLATLGYFDNKPPYIHSCTIIYFPTCGQHASIQDKVITCLRHFTLLSAIARALRMSAHDQNEEADFMCDCPCSRVLVPRLQHATLSLWMSIYDSGSLIPERSPWSRAFPFSAAY